MVPETVDFLVDKHDLRRTRFAPGRDTSELAPGQILVRIDHFALTANNITYGAVGDQLGYWSFFLTDDPAWGRVPVWGFGSVVASTHEDVAVGERLYGYWPMSTHVALTPGEVSRGGFTDAAAHRARLPAVYNRYERVGTAASPDEPALALFRPLFTTAWLLDDFLAEHDVFGAQRVILTSASSKTSLGLAQLLHARGRVRVAGLTAAKNAAFVTRTGYYHEVVAYDDVATLPADEPAVLVDMAGVRAVRHAVHERLGDRLRYSSAVGRSHWEADPGAPGPLPGPQPTFFFAPQHAQKRMAELGARDFAGQLAGATRAFLASTQPWLRVVEGQGETAVEDAYRAQLEGTADPASGFVVGL
jgi:NADPH:quinone reductase-like Zn-dependent oxidoreductase